MSRSFFLFRKLENFNKVKNLKYTLKCDKINKFIEICCRHFKIKLVNLNEIEIKSDSSLNLILK
ncbi:hypothetical protein HMPREF1552_00313 [Leptotrichia sp. oral taxon 879 str. F0557]|nr:hypothetical protein HMPREF1552_00313 [Leptotrichia sp. oral taxon 879 str. F0557]